MQKSTHNKHLGIEELCPQIHPKKQNIYNKKNYRKLVRQLLFKCIWCEHFFHPKKIIHFKQGRKVRKKNFEKKNR